MPKRLAGGYLGARPPWQAYSLPGVWSAEDVYQRIVAKTWPWAADPHFSNVPLLLHLNGTNGSQVFTDSSSSGRVVTAVGAASISNAQSLYGGTSGYFNGTNAYLTVPFSSDFMPGADDFTIEASVRLVARQGAICGIWDDSSNARQSWLLHFEGGKLTFTADTSVANDQRVMQQDSLLPLNTWLRLAMVKLGTFWGLYAEGDVVASTTQNASIKAPDGVNPFAIGGQPGIAGGYLMSAYMNGFRYTRLVGRYPDPYTPPADRFPDR